MACYACGAEGTLPPSRTEPAEPPQDREMSDENLRERSMPEKEFYKQHYGGGVEVGTTPLDVFEREMLIPDKRYGLVSEYLLKDQPVGGFIKSDEAAPRRC